MKPVILIGFMGAGKTTVGRELSRLLRVPLIDTDQYIEEKEGLSISELFGKYGEGWFRQRETQALVSLLEDGRDAVISCGGGLPLKEENRKLLKKAGRVVYLRIKPETVCERLRGDTSRPLLAGADAREKVSTLMKERESRYRAAADVTIDVDTLTAKETALRIAGWTGKIS